MKMKITVSLNDKVGSFIDTDGIENFNALDGSGVAAWLKSQGYTVVKHYDTGRNGIAITADGYKVSTNGYVSK